MPMPRFLPFAALAARRPSKPSQSILASAASSTRTKSPLS